MGKGLRLWHKLPHLPLRILLLALCAWALYIISIGWTSPSVTPTTTFPRHELQQLNSWQFNRSLSIDAPKDMFNQLFDKRFSKNSKYSAIHETQQFQLTKVNALKQNKHYEEFHDLNNNLNLLRNNIDWEGRAKNTKNTSSHEKVSIVSHKESLAYGPYEGKYREGSILNHIQPRDTKSGPPVKTFKLNEFDTYVHETDYKDTSSSPGLNKFSQKKFELKLKTQRSSTTDWRDSEVYLSEIAVHKTDNAVRKNSSNTFSKASKYIAKYGSNYTFSLKHRYARPFLTTLRNEGRPINYLGDHHGTNQEITEASHFSNRITEFKTILLWTSLYNGWDFLPLGPGAFLSCSEIHCEVTSDRNRLKDSHAVVFHVRTMSLLDLPPFRLPHQKWIFFSLESPPQSYFPGFHFMHGMFNWTMTYRSDSDIVIPYGRVFPRNDSKMDAKWRKGWESLWKKKTKPVVWMVSHCDTFSKRELYVHELQKFIDVDILGSCGSAVCLFNETYKCLEAFSRRYKFFLAFENSICDDYVTEKFFRALKYDIIPVVLGGADYKAVAPPGSYINAADYSSPKALADYLHRVSENSTLYRMYFRWKEVGYVVQDKPSHCSLCQKIHSPDFQSVSMYNNMINWWVENSHCTKWKLK